MNRVDQPVELPVRKIEGGNGRTGVTRIDRPPEMDEWGEVVNGPISTEGMSVIEEFFGMTPTITMWSVANDGSTIPNVHKFSLPTASRGVEFIFRIWQDGVGNNGRAGIDVYANDGSHTKGFSYSSGNPDGIVWIGIGRGQLLVATEHGILYRAMRQRSNKQIRRGRIWRFSKVLGFRIEVSSLRDPMNQFARYVPAHLR